MCFQHFLSKGMLGSSYCTFECVQNILVGIKLTRWATYLSLFFQLHKYNQGMHIKYFIHTLHLAYI